MKHFPYSTFSKIMFLSLPCFCVTIAHAQTDAANLEIALLDGERNSFQEVVVVGQKDAPITIEPRGLAVSLGEDHFKSTNAINVEDLMKYAPNFFVRKRYIGDANGVPGFRGTHSSQSARSMVLVDGFVVSNYLGNSFGYPPKWGVVGPGEVEQFDIVYGPYSSRYAGNSMGGIISITTQAPTKNEAFVTLQGFSQAYKQYGTDDTYNGYTFEGGFALKQDDGPFSMRGSYRHFDNVGQPQMWSQLTPSKKTSRTVVTGAVNDPELIAPVGTTPPPVFSATSADDNQQDQLRLRADLEFDNWKAEALLVYWTTDSDTSNPVTYLRDTNGNPVYTGTVNIDGQYWDTTTLNLSLTERTELLAGIRVQGEISGWDTTTNLSHFWADKNLALTSNGYTNGINKGAGTATSNDPYDWWTLDAKATNLIGIHEVTFGLTSNIYESKTTTYNTTNWETASNKSLSLQTAGKTNLNGIFVEDEIHLRDNLSVTGGLRADQWKAFDGSILKIVAAGALNNEYEERTEDAINGAASLQWQLAPHWLTQLSLATATRFPTVSELFQGKFDSSNNFDPNSFDPNLKPESSRDVNLILRYDFPKVRLTGSVFYQNVEDFIFSFEHQVPLTNAKATSFVNIDEVRQIGAEFIIESNDLVLTGLNVDLNIAHIDAEVRKNNFLPVSEGNQFPRIPYWRINGQARYTFADDWRISLGTRYNSRPNTNLEGTQRGSTYGYSSEQFIIDSRLSWQMNDTTELSAGVDNITNDKAWAYHPFPQRTYLVELKWKR